MPFSPRVPFTVIKLHSISPALHSPPPSIKVCGVHAWVGKGEHPMAEWRFMPGPLQDQVT